MKLHWDRFLATLRCAYRPGHPLWPAYRNSPFKGCVGEFFHALKNLLVEEARRWGIELNPRRR